MAREGAAAEATAPPLLRIPPATQPLQEAMPPWQCEGTGSRPGWGTGFLFAWGDLPNLKGVRAGGGLAPRRVLKQLVRFRPF